MPVHVLYFASGCPRARGHRPRDARAKLPPSPSARNALAEAHPGLRRHPPAMPDCGGRGVRRRRRPLRDGAEIAIVPLRPWRAPRFQVVDRPLARRGRGRGVGARPRRDRRSRARCAASRTASGSSSSSTRPTRRWRSASSPRSAPRSRAHGVEVAIVHRVISSRCEAAVVIACAAAHRTPAFGGCEACIERLKQDVPIWKREVHGGWVGVGKPSPLTPRGPGAARAILARP